MKSVKRLSQAAKTSKEEDCLQKKHGVTSLTLCEWLSKNCAAAILLAFRLIALAVLLIAGFFNRLAHTRLLHSAVFNFKLGDVGGSMRRLRLFSTFLLR